MYSLFERFCRIFGLGILVLLFAGCGGGGGGFSGGGQEQTTTTTEPLSITTDSLEGGTVGQTYLQLLKVQGGASNTEVQWVSDGRLPPGLTLDPSLGTISGKPTTAGTYPFLVQAQDTNNSSLTSDAKQFSITIAALPSETLTPLSITTTSPLPNGTVNQSYLTLLTGEGGGSKSDFSWSVSSGQLPSGLQLTKVSSTQSQIQGTPTQSQSLPFTFFIKMQDIAYPSLKPVIQEFSITIQGEGGGAAKVKDVQLLASSIQLASAGDNPVTLTAVVRDINNNTLKDATVTFKADNNGTVQVTRSITDAAGTAEALLSTRGYQGNRQINVTATAGGAEDSAKIDVVGTNITITGSAAVGVGEPTTFTFNLLDSAGKGVPNQTLSVSSKNLNNVVPPSPITDASGKATVQITGANLGTDVITVSGAGTVAQKNLTVSPDKFVFTTPDPAAASMQEILINTSFAIAVEWKQNTVPVTNGEIKFIATRGTITPTAKTDRYGKAYANIQSDTAGRSLIVATTDSGLSVQIEVLFVATQPHSFYLQANPSTLNPFQQSTVKALVFDINGNPVKGVTITFNLFDPTGGVISNPSAVTNESGETTITYTAAATISGVNQVKITATVVQNTSPSLQDIATITVAGRAVFIRFGTGNLIELPDSVTYSKPYRVWVTDVAGNPVAGATVKLKVIPLSYSKGDYRKPIGNETTWQQQISVSGCPNEDVNLNGRLDIPPDIDYNHNGELEPGNVASVVSTVTTGDDGSAFFRINYGRNYAYWVTVQLTGSANVAGSEATESTSPFSLPGVVGDFNNKDVNPPNNPSPFGVANSCADPN
ncbi:MAG: Ig-like domain-containing protein [Candidatus Competibacteraceae bacterium]